MKHSFLIFMMLFAFAFPLSVFAQEGQASAAAVLPTPTPTQVIEYQLPYPGLLPDSPLYFLKATRDRIIAFLVSTPQKKAELDLFQSDKRLNAGIYLFKGGKQDLAVSTISKGENYFEEAILQTQQAKKQGLQIDNIVSNFQTSVKKHQEVLKDLAKKSTGQNKQALETMYKKSQKYEKDVNKLFLSK